MKILYLLEYFPRKISQTFVVNEMIALQKMGVDVAVAAFNTETVFHDVIHKNNLLDKRTVIYGTASPWRRLIISLLLILKIFLTDPRTAFRVLRLSIKKRYAPNVVIHALSALSKIKEIRDIDCIHISFPNRVYIAVGELAYDLWQIPFTATYRARDIYSDITYRRFSPDCSAIITISQFNKENLQKVIPFHADIPVIHSAINPDFFIPRQKPSAINKIRIGFIGRFIPKKGGRYLIDAATYLNAKKIPFSLRFVGDGPEVELYKERIEEQGLSDHVKLLGNLPQQDIRLFLAELDVFVLPCITDQEGNRDILPNVLKEAMAAEVPVITTHINGIEELVEDGVNGVLVPQKSPESIGVALTRFYNDPDSLTKIGKAGRRKIVAEFNVTDEAAKLRSVFSQIIAGRDNNAALN
ncbi:MAG: glycosyltransferase [Fibrobacterota bacterium]